MPDQPAVPPRSIVRIGTRGSALARWQTDHVGELLLAAWPGLVVEVEVFVTQGDRTLDRPLPQIGGKGLFTAELESALHAGTIDLAVHSLKDLPTEHPAGLTIGATPTRADPRDVLISRTGKPLAELPPNARVGTSSLRRAAQLLRVRPDIQTIDIRGNIDTRIRKALDPAGPYDAIVLAAAGVLRLGKADVVTEFLAVDTMLPAPGQAALGLQCRDESDMLRLLAPIDDGPTAACVAAERSFLAGLGGGCSVPVAALCVQQGSRLHLRGRVSRADGSTHIDVGRESSSGLAAAIDLGSSLARDAILRGADVLLGTERHPSSPAAE